MYAKQPNAPKIVQFSLDLSVAAGTNAIATASMAGPIEITGVSIYCSVVGATWTSVALHDDTAAANEIMGTTKGAVANFTAGAILPLDWNFARPFHLEAGSSLEYTLAGSTGSGTALLTVQYVPVKRGGTLDIAA